MSMVYLLTGQDNFSKDAKLAQIKEQVLARKTEQFNLTVLHARDVRRKDLQEELLRLPAVSKRRLLIIRGIQGLRQECQDVLLAYLRKPSEQLAIVLEADRFDLKSTFLRQISRQAKTFRFREAVSRDVFALSRTIEKAQAVYALRLLHELMKQGEKPERILGGLRYSLSRSLAGSRRLPAVLQLLLACDLAIKQGRLKATFAVEKTVVDLCRLIEALHES